MSVSKSFERTMTKSSPKCLTIPAQFVRKFGGRIHDVVQVKMASATRLWTVKLNVYFMKKQPHVSFGAGWKQFMRTNFIFQGQKVKFTLIGTSLFEVSRVTNHANRVPHFLPQQGPRRRRSSRLLGANFDRAHEAKRNRLRCGAPPDASEVIVIDE